MDLQNNREDLLAAWKALSGHEPENGWKTIPVFSGNTCCLLAGRHFPGNKEALIAGFNFPNMPPYTQLPQGRGFLVSKIDLDYPEPKRTWISLCRKDEGNPELFARMADDVLHSMSSSDNTRSEFALQNFLTRIKAWQAFMQREGEGTLKPEEEVGLFGELEFLRDLILLGLPASLTVDAWQGPLDGIHDFVLGKGAIEVKSTLALRDFPVTINTLEQLDDSFVSPLFLAGVRLSLNDSGRTLATLIDGIRNQLECDGAALDTFNIKLLHAGYFNNFETKYVRKFLKTELKILLVSDSFPKLTRNNIPNEIKSVKYIIDINNIKEQSLDFNKLLAKLGVI